ncbi:MAG: tetratricopeptide repeat protein [Burkholderiales bacterium]
MLDWFSGVFGRRRKSPPDTNKADTAKLVAANALLKSGKLEAAEREVRTFLGDFPLNIAAQSLLAGILSERDKHEEACALCERILNDTPQDTNQLCATAQIHWRAGRYTRALQFCDQALRLDPSYIQAWLVRANSFQSLGRQPEALQAFNRILELNPDDRDFHSSVLFFLYRSDVLPAYEIRAAHERWATLHANTLTQLRSHWNNQPNPTRRLKIGYVSGDFRTHVVSFFIEPLLRAHDKTEFDVYCYSNGKMSDATTERLLALAGHWRDIHLLDDESVAKLIRDDCIDILVDLSGHTFGNRLLVFARKPAPLQVTWLGYIGTTGLKAMDYIIGDPNADLPGKADADFSEKILRLPVSRWCFTAPRDAPAVTPLPASRSGTLVFGSFTNFSRLNDDIFSIWSKILAALPSSKLKLIGVTPGESLDRMLEIFELAGVTASRLELHARLGYAQCLEQMGNCDIALDSYPLNGGTTTFEALWMGVPVISRAGEFRAARSSLSILGAIGLGNLCSRSPEEYISIAIDLAQDQIRLSELRMGLRDQMRASPLMDAAKFTSDLERAYRSIWREYCATRSSAHAAWS